jgi:multiple sugar transport system permease protein
MEWNVPYDRRGLVGVRNFVRLILDLSFRRAFINNVWYAAICLSVELVLGFCLAQLLTKNFVGKNFVRILLLIPFLTAPTLAGLEFRWIYNREYGLLNHILEALHLFPKQSWLVDPTLAFISVMLVDIWQHTPFMMLLLLAGLETLPTSPYEAATVDGASWFQKFRFITIPLLRPVIAIACMLRVIDLFRVFDTIFIITQGGPAGRTELLSVYLYRVAFQYGKLGYAAAGSWYTLIFSLLIILPILNRMRKFAG